MARIKKWTPVLVKWADAVTHSDPQDSTDPALVEPAVRYSVGHLLAWDRRKGITIAMEDDHEAGTEGDCQTVTHIVQGMILQVTVLVMGEVAYTSGSRKKKIKQPLDNTTE